MAPFVHSLRFRLLALVSVALLPALAVILYNGLEERRTARSEAQTRLQRLVEQASRQESQLIQGTHQLLLSLAQTPEVRRLDPAASVALFARIRDQGAAYDNFGLIGADGYVIASLHPLAAPVYLGDRPHFQKALKEREFDVTKLQISRILHKPTVVCVYPVLNDSGQIQAVLFANLNLNWLQDLAAWARLPAGSVLATIDDQGAIMGKYPHPERWAGVTIPKEGVFAALQKQGDGMAEGVGMDGTPRLYAFTRLGGEADRGHVYAGIPLGKVYREATWVMMRNLAGLGMALCLSLGLAWWFGALMIARRVDILTQTAARLAAEDLSVRTHLEGGPDELTRLARAFDHMADTLEHRQAERLQASRVLQETTARLEALINSSPAAIYVLNQNAEITLWNSAAENIFGWRSEELLGRPLPYIPGDRVQGLLAHKRRLEQEGESLSNVETVRLKKDGTPVHISLSASPFTDAQGQAVGVVVVALDITARRQAEEALKDSEHKYRELVENANSIILRWTKEGVITFLNEFGQKFFGFPEEEIIGRHVMDTIVPRTESTGRNLQPLIAEICNDPKKFEYNINENVRRNGERVWIAWTNKIIFDSQGQLVEILSIGSDITDRKRAEDRLKQRTEELMALNALAQQMGASLSLEEVATAALDRGFYPASPDLAMLYLREDNHLVLQGVRPELPSLGRQERELQLGECLCGLALKQGKPVYSDDIHTDPRCTLSACKEAGMHSFAALPLLSGEHILGVLGLAWTAAQDLAAQAGFLETSTGEIAMGVHNALLYRELQQHASELDHRVKERTQQLQAANKELEAFAYSISHDLRAPLRAVSGFAQIVARRHRAALNEEGQRYVDNIVLAGERMGYLIDDLLAYARLGRQALTLRPVALGNILKQVGRELAERVAEAGASLQIAENLPVIHGDHTLLGQVFTNLLVNALTYRRPEVAPEIQVSWRPENGQVVVAVSDNGIGIAPEYQAKIFNVFQRLHSHDDYPGTGIGLAIVKKAVEMLGGRVWVESVVGQGSTFYVKMPQE